MRSILDDGTGTKKVGVIFSGGIDSTVLVAALLREGHEVHLICFDDDTPMFKNKELVAINAVTKHYGLASTQHIMRLYNTDRMVVNDTYGFVPGWKMTMQIIAMAQCHAAGITHLCYGYIDDNLTGYKDERPHMIKRIAELYNTVYSEEGANVKVLTPFYHLSKEEVIRIGANLDVPFQYTFSCGDETYPSITHCGKCVLCQRRVRGFAIAGVADTGLYWPK